MCPPTRLPFLYIRGPLIIAFKTDLLSRPKQTLYERGQADNTPGTAQTCDSTALSKGCGEKSFLRQFLMRSGSRGFGTEDCNKSDLRKGTLEVMS